MTDADTATSREPQATSYTAADADEGMAFKVRVSFTDDAGYEESLTSALARSNRPYALTAAASDGAVVLIWNLPAGFPYQRDYYRIMRNRPELGEAEPLVHVSYTDRGGTHLHRHRRRARGAVRVPGEGSGLPRLGA